MKHEKIKSRVKDDGDPEDAGKGSRRTKERKIGEVIQKVQKWRQLYQQDCQSLEDAAKKVGISKKSLDDYFLQLKNGKANGFNFNEHKSDKIGILRNWNKTHRENKQAASKAAVTGEGGEGALAVPRGRKVGRISKKDK